MNTALNALLSLAVIGMLSASVFSQERSQIECPGTRVIASAEAVTEGEKVSFQLELIGGNVDRSKLEYNWSVKHGRVVSGQGTPVIFVSTAGLGSDGSITATVDHISVSRLRMVHQRERLYSKERRKNKGGHFLGMDLVQLGKGTIR